MEDERNHLHKLVDDLPADALHRAERALQYCVNPLERQFTIEQVRERVKQRARKSLEDQARTTGRGFIGGLGSGGAITMPDGDFRSSMTGWDNGPVTYHLRGFSGYMFEIYERLELATDRTKLVLSQTILAPDGSEHVLTANLPVPADRH